MVSDGMPTLAWDGDDRMPKVVMPMVVLPMVVIPIVVMPMTTLLNWWCEA